MLDILILFLVITILALLYFLIQNLINLFVTKYGKQNNEYYDEYYNEPYIFKYQDMQIDEEPTNDIYECFRFLGFESIPTEKELKARYRQLAKEKHPDRGGTPEEFEKINKAYSDSLKILNAKK